MLSRTHLRIEAMHHLFSFYARTQAAGSPPPLVADSQLSHSLDHAFYQLRRLHLACLQLLVAWQSLDCARASSQLLKPAHHLGEVALLQALATDATFVKLQSTYPLPWTKEEVKVCYYEALAEAPLFVAYKQGGASTPAEEHTFLKGLVSKVLFKNKGLQALFAAEDGWWHHHRPIVRRQVLLFFEQWVATPSKAFVSYHDDGVTQHAYYDALLDAVLAKSEQYDKALQVQAPQWDLDRILLLDKVLIKMALAELATNEESQWGALIHAYLEIAKTYSSPKSPMFINGMVDTLARLEIAKERVVVPRTKV